jgi:prepilin-type N-terminal cleavage/methylation domain-containing protein
MKKNKAFSLVELSVVILIIGILIAGVTQSGRLIRQIKLSTARSVTASSDVNSIRDVTGWFEASTEGSFRIAGGSSEIQNEDEILEWHDYNTQKSAFDKPTLVNSTTGTYPKYRSNGINGIPAVYFDGSNDYISFELGGTVTDPKFPVIEKDRNFSIFTVFRADPSALANDRIVTQISGLPTSNALVDYTYAGIGIFSSKKTGLIVTKTEGDNFLVNYALQDQTDYIVGAVADFPVEDATDPTRENVKMYLNSSNVASQITSGNFQTNVGVGNKRLIIGAGNLGGDKQIFFKGLIAEVIYFDRAIKKEEAQSVMKYLQKKYGIKDISLAADAT